MVKVNNSEQEAGKRCTDAIQVFFNNILNGT